ncbi:MAG: restriction endonuclease subunit S [Eikenella sp.]|nr:restriction endonuclease subunit S [Eikenella sp.]
MKHNPIMEKLITSGVLAGNTAVEWKPLGEVVRKVSSGGTPKTGVSEYYDGGDIPWLRTQEINFGEIWDTGIKITEDGIRNSSAKWIPENCVIVAMYGATVGKVAINKIPMTTNQACANIESNEKILYHRYLFHYLWSQYEYIKSLGVGSQTNINTQIIKKLMIPIPPLEVQHEIVRVLDNFTELTAEFAAALTAELTARKKQYEYYRNFLLTFENHDTELLTNERTNVTNPFANVDVVWKTLGEITLPTSNIKWKETDRTYRYIDLTSVDRENHSIGETNEISSENAPGRAQKIVEKNDIIFATTRPTQLRFALIDDAFSGEVASTGYCVLRANPSEVLFKWIYHGLGTERFRIFLEDNQSGSAYPAISDSRVKEYKIPIPPLDTQAEIVAILDRFDALTNSISEGLPREIELRQKQYEYYRERLLSFA